MIRQTMVLTKICVSTWGATLLRARHVYTAVIRPAMTFGSNIWLSEKNKKRELSNWVENKLGKIQNNCFKKIVGAYKTISKRKLKKKMNIMPLTMHMQQLKINFQIRMRNTAEANELRKVKEKIKQRLTEKQRKSRKYKNTPEKISVEQLNTMLTSQTISAVNDTLTDNLRAMQKTIKRNYRQI